MTWWKLNFIRSVAPDSITKAQIKKNIDEGLIKVSEPLAQEGASESTSSLNYYENNLKISII